MPAVETRGSQQPVASTLPSRGLQLSPFSLHKPWGPQAWPSCPSLTTHPLALPQSEEEGRLYFSMDDGQTRFTDLLQLVEFHQLNRGILPCLLRHGCTRVAL